MWRLAAAVFLIMVNVCAALENIEFKLGGRKFNVPLNHPIYMTHVKSADLVDLKFSISKLTELLPSIVENAHRAQSEERAPNTPLAGDAGKQDLPDPVLVQETTLHQEVAIPFPLAGSLATIVEPTLTPFLPENIPQMSVVPLERSSETATEAIESPPILSEIHKPFKTPLALGISPLVVKNDKAPLSTLKAKLYLPVNKTREIPIMLHYFTVAPISKVTSPSTITSLHSIVTPKPYSLVTSPSIASLPLFPEWRLHTSVVTALPDTTPTPMIAVLPDTALVSDTNLVAVEIRNLDMEAKTVPMAVPVTSLEQQTPLESDTTPVLVTSTGLDTTPLLKTTPVSVTSLETDTILVSAPQPLKLTNPYMTPMLETSQESDRILVLGTTQVPVTSPEPDTTPVSMPNTSTAPDESHVVTNIASLVSTSSLVQVSPMSITTPKLPPLVTSPVIASIPLFPEWRLHKRLITQTLGTTSESDSITFSTTLRPEQDTILVTDAMPVLITLLEPDTTPVSDVTLVPVKSTDPDTKQASNSMKLLTTPPEVDTKSVLDTKPVPVKSQELNTTPVQELITSTFPDETHDVKNIASSVSTSPLVQVKSMPIATPKLRSLVTSPVIASIPLFPEWRLNKRVVTPFLDATPTSGSVKFSTSARSGLDTTLVPDVMPVAVTSLELTSTPVSDTSPGLVTSTYPDMTQLLVTTKPVPEMSPEPDQSLVSDTTPESEPDGSPVLDTSPVPATLVETSTSGPALVTSTVSDETFVVTNDALPVSTSKLVIYKSKSIETPKLHPLVTSPLMASIPLFPEWRLHKSAGSPFFDTTPSSESINLLKIPSEIEPIISSDTTPLIMVPSRTESKPMPVTRNPNMPLKIASIENFQLIPEWRLHKSKVPLLDWNPVLDTIPIQETSTESDQILGSDLTSESLTSTEPKILPVLDTIVVTQNAPVSDTTPISETSREIYTTPVTDTTPELSKSPNINTALGSETIPAVISTKAQMVPMADSLLIHKEIITALTDTMPVPETLLRQDTSESVTSPPLESTSVSNTKPDLMTLSYMGLIPVSGNELEQVTSPEIETTHFSELATTQESVISIAPVPATSQVQKKTSDSDTVIAPVTLPVLTSIPDTAPVVLLPHATDRTPVSDATPVPIASFEPDTTYVSGTMAETGTDTTTVLETTREAMSSSQPTSLLSVPDTALVTDTTVILLTSSLLLETTVASMTSDLLSDNNMIPVTSSLVSDMTASPPIRMSTTALPLTAYSATIKDGARTADKATSRSSPIRTTRVPCIRRKSSKKKGRPGRRCRKSRSTSLQNVSGRARGSGARAPRPSPLAPRPEPAQACVAAMTHSAELFTYHG